MKQYCMYGYGKPTERSYYYQQGQYEDNGVETEGDFAQVRSMADKIHDTRS